MGPNCPAAEQEGEERFNKVMLEIEKEEGFPSAKDLEEKDNKRFYRNYGAAREKLRVAFRELYLAEACDTW